MGRPKRIQQPAKLNLLVERETKSQARALAMRRGISVGRLFEEVVRQMAAEELPKRGEPMTRRGTERPQKTMAAAMRILIKNLS